MVRSPSSMSRRNVPTPPGRARSCRATTLAWLLAAFAALPVAFGAGDLGELSAALAASPDSAHGASLYGTCAICHGTNGGGVADGRVPAIGGQPRAVIIKQLADFRRKQRIDLRMEHFADRRHLTSAQDLADVAAHVAMLKRDVPAGLGTGQALAAGASAWFAHCERCHGATGQADEARLNPRLAGQHAAYLERQLLDTLDGRRPNMTEVHRRSLQRLTSTQIAGIADYLSRMN